MKHLPPLLLLIPALLASCHAQLSTSSSTPEGAADEPEVIVASIDPALPRPGAELRLAKIELAREDGNPLAGYVAVALTGDRAAVEILIRGLGDTERCADAGEALAFLPAKLAPRPLWLALRLDCSTEAARTGAEALGLGRLVDDARQAEELPEMTGAPEEAADSPMDASCAEATAALRGLPREANSLPTVLAPLAQSAWELPTDRDGLCDETALAAALRLRQGDPAVRLAFDLLLDSPGRLDGHLVTFVTRYGLGGATERLAARAAEADGRICAAMIRADNLEPLLPLLTATPEEVPICLRPAVRALDAQADDAAERAALESIARSARYPGCGAGALAAALKVTAAGGRPPRWAADAPILGKALAETIATRHNDGSPPTLETYRRLHAALARLRPGDRRREPPAPQPIRLFQRDIRTVLPTANADVRSALEALLEDGTR